MFRLVESRSLGVRSLVLRSAGGPFADYDVFLIVQMQITPGNVLLKRFEWYQSP